MSPSPTLVRSTPACTSPAATRRIASSASTSPHAWRCTSRRSMTRSTCDAAVSSRDQVPHRSHDMGGRAHHGRLALASVLRGKDARGEKAGPNADEGGEEPDDDHRSPTRRRRARIELRRFVAGRQRRALTKLLQPPLNDYSRRLAGQWRRASDLPRTRSPGLLVARHDRRWRPLRRPPRRATRSPNRQDFRSRPHVAEGIEPVKGIEGRTRNGHRRRRWSPSP